MKNLFKTFFGQTKKGFHWQGSLEKLCEKLSALARKPVSTTKNKAFVKK